jgi:hypothetical protein
VSTPAKGEKVSGVGHSLRDNFAPAVAVSHEVVVMAKKRGTGASGKGKEQTPDHQAKARSKKREELVLIITATGTAKFKQELIDALKIIDLKTVFDEHEENRICVEDIHGGNVLWPDYQIPEELDE